LNSVDTYIRTDTGELDDMVPLVASFLEKNILDLVIDGRTVRGYRTPDARSLWIRDYSDMLRGIRYFEPDVRSVVDHFAETQAASGRIFDYVTTFPERPPGERENWTRYVRVPVEADVEFRLVKAAWLAWQATGDIEWIRSLIPALEKALGYTTRHPWRWDSGHGLVKRPYTIDTWDFAYTAGKHDWLQFQINEDTYWGIMHGDNSGYCEAFRILARFHQRLGNPEAAREWSVRADRLRDALNRVCWNGRFYTHFVKLSEVDIPGVDEESQLSLSNPMAINRGAAGHERAVAILDEYRARGRRKGGFAEWFSIDPPFPGGVFGDDRLVPGAYVNGGIMPLVGGELALAALEHGREKYGVEILKRYHDIICASGESYLWYFPDGRPSGIETSTSPEATPTDGWGSTAMLHALMTGLAGVQDRDRLFRRVRLCPRWPAAGVRRADVRTGYAASGAFFEYSIEYGESSIRLEMSGRDADVEVHLLLPEGGSADSVRAGGLALDFDVSRMEESIYLDFTTRGISRTEVRIGLS